MFLKRKLTQRKCGFKNIVSTAQFQALGKVDEFLMMDLGLSLKKIYLWLKNLPPIAISVAEKFRLHSMSAIQRLVRIR